MTEFADVLDNFRAKGNLENRSLQTIMCFFVPQVKSNEPAKFTSNSWFGSTTSGSFPRSLCFLNGLRFVPAFTHAMNLDFPIIFRPPNVECRQALHGDLERLGFVKFV